jgi:hypothetical protein
MSKVFLWRCFRTYGVEDLIQGVSRLIACIMTFHETLLISAAHPPIKFARCASMISLKIKK